jgi:Ca2+-transporting ATPase
MQSHTTETIGAVTVVCTSRTGPLTGHAMMVTDVRTATRAYGVTGDGYAPGGTFVTGGRAVPADSDPDLWLTLRIAATTSHADVTETAGGWTPRGDPMDAALTVAARKAGIERSDMLFRASEIATLPYSVRRGLMATFHRGLHGGTLTACVKGAPDRVLALCSHMQSDGARVPLDDVARASVLTANRLMATRGLRVIALARGNVDRPQEEGLANLTFAGLIGLSDPPAPGAAEAIEAFRQAGVRTVMLTGDQRETAAATAGELGLEHGSPAVLDGPELERMPDVDLRERLGRVNVFSRVTPQAVRRIVNGLRMRGEVVMMVGQRVTQAATLRSGTASAPAWRSATALDEVVSAIRQGRVYIDNVRKLVFYIVSCGLAGTLLFLGAGGFGWKMPVAHAVWLALVTAVFPALALKAEPAQPDVMQRPPRTLRAALMSPAYVRAIVVYAAFLTVATLLVVGWSRAAGIPAERAMTMNIMALGHAQLLHLGNARDRAPVLSPARAFANGPALFAVGLALTLQVMTVMAAPLREWLHLAPLAPIDWAVVAVAGVLPAIAGQLLKGTHRARMV